MMPITPRSPATGRRRILIVEDHTIIREGLRSLMAESRDLEVVGEAGDGLEALRAVEKLQPDLVIMDLSMPRMQGVDAIREITRRFPRSRCIALTMCRDEDSFLAAMRAGAGGYVLKDATCQELLGAIRRVLDGKTYLSPDLSRAVLDGYLDGKAQAGNRGGWESLTPRERQVLKMVAEGGTNRVISDALCISPKTVDRHRTSLMRKLDLHTTAALTVYAVRKGIVS